MSDERQPIKGSQPIVYVREADRDGLPDHLKSAPGKIFSIHDPTGRVVAMADDRNVAFALARRNDLTPVSVH